MIAPWRRPDAPPFAPRLSKPVLSNAEGGEQCRSARPDSPIAAMPSDAADVHFIGRIHRRKMGMVEETSDPGFIQL